MYLRPQIVTVDIFYYIPNTHIINEFIWQTEDIVPKLPRIHKFLTYWKSDVQAVVNEIIISYAWNNIMRNATLYTI